MAQRRAVQVNAAAGTTLLKIEKDSSSGNGGSTNGNACLASGFGSLDNLLGGGFPIGKVTLISTSASIAKSALSYSIITNHLIDKPESEAVVIDSSGEFSVHVLLEVVEQVLKARRCALPMHHQGYIYETASSSNLSSAVDAEAVTLLDRVKILRVFNISGMVEAVSEVRQVCRSQVKSWAGSSSFRKVDLVMADDLTATFQTMQTRNNIQAQSLLSSLFRSLSQLARTHNTCVIVYNSLVENQKSAMTRAEEEADHDEIEMVSSFPLVSQKPALGKTVSHLADLSLMMFAHPRGRLDAEAAYTLASAAGNTVWSPAYVLEVLNNGHSGENGDVAVFEVRHHIMRELAVAMDEE